MSLKECMDKGLIKKDSSCVGRVPESLKISGKFLEEARGNLKMICTKSTPA